MQDELTFFRTLLAQVEEYTENLMYEHAGKMESYVMEIHELEALASEKDAIIAELEKTIEQLEQTIEQV